MPLVTITAPAVEPVTVAEAKAFARIESDHEDDLIGNLITTARELVETTSGRALVARKLELRLRDFPYYQSGLIRLPRSPLISVEHVKYRDADGDLQTLTENVDYLVDASAEPPTIEPVNRWPTTGQYPDAVQIRFEAGYAPEGSPADYTANIPQRARVAVMALSSHWYDERQPVPDGPRVKEMPLHVSRLIAGLRVWG